MATLETMTRLWNGWEIRTLVLLSLSLQVILIAFGSKRKTKTSTWIKVLVWSAYLSADAVATTTLGILARSMGENHSLQSFWAPFLVLHLGGPDTITAYSLEDNELWLRHLLGLVLNVGVAGYVLLRSWLDGDTTFLSISILVFVAGIIKYGERTYVLMSSSSKRFRKSLFQYDYTVFKMNVEAYHFQDNFLNRVDFFFKRLKFLLADVVIEASQGYHCLSMTRSLTRTKAFQLVEFELGLLYDLLYTKARLVDSFFGIFLRFITCLASVSALVAFSIISNEHSPADVSISYILLVGAVVLEVYAMFMLISSDWLKLRLHRHEKMPSYKPREEDKRWSRSIARFNLLSVCFKEVNPTLRIKVQRLLGIHEKLWKGQHVKREQVDENLQTLIFNQLASRTNVLDSSLKVKQKWDGKKQLNDVRGESSTDGEQLKNSEQRYRELLDYRGDGVLAQMKSLDNQTIYELKASTIDVEFDESILRLHIATELCYHDDNRTPSFSTHNEESKNSRLLSDYMLYLLVMCPNMLPKGIGAVRFKNVCKDLMHHFKEKRVKEIQEACTELLHSGGPDILSSASELAKRLQNDLGRVEKWKIMEQVWVELLTYAAVHCDWKEHGQHLAKGGELLSHVCVLMANFGKRPKRDYSTLWDIIITCHRR